MHMHLPCVLLPNLLTSFQTQFEIYSLLYSFVSHKDRIEQEEVKKCLLLGDSLGEIGKSLSALETCISNDTWK